MYKSHIAADLGTYGEDVDLLDEVRLVGNKSYFLILFLGRWNSNAVASLDPTTIQVLVFGTNDII